MKKQECSQLFVAIVPFLCAFLFAFWLWRYLRQPEPDTDRLTVAITYTNYAIVVTRPCVEETGFSPVFISRKQPVPYVFFASPGA